MQLCRVVGSTVSTVKAPGLADYKLLNVTPAAGDGPEFVAVDAVGAGVGEHVFFVRGKEASFPFYPAEVPADAGIVGIVDHWDV